MYDRDIEVAVPFDLLFYEFGIDDDFQTMFEIRPEIHEWFDTHLSPEYYLSMVIDQNGNNWQPDDADSNFILYFDTMQEALLFKLTWSGGMVMNK